MPEELETILRRVATGELSPEEAEPLVAAATQGMDAASQPTEPGPRAHDPGPRPNDPGPRPNDPGPRPTSGIGAQRRVTLKVMEGGRAVVHLRVPTSWASLASSVLPGLSGTHAERIREAIRAGEIGPILDVRDEDGDGVIISTE
jgi:hypothetical protein